MVVERELAGVVRIDDSITIRIQKPLPFDMGTLQGQLVPFDFQDIPR